MNDIYLSLVGALPLIVIVVAIAKIMLIDLFVPRAPRDLYSIIGVGACFLSWACSVGYWYGPERAFHSQLNIDPLTFIFYTVILGGTALSLLLNSRQLEAQRVRQSVDVDVLTLCATFGAMVMVSANHLIVLFLGFEILSVAVYVLSGAARGEKASAEGALKYFLLGAFSSAFLLYGMVLVFGATGSMLLHEIRISVQSSVGASPLLLAGVALLLLGFGFKLSLVPFHFWAPDAYQGAPVSVTTYMAAVVKAAAFGSLLRLLAVSFAPVSASWIGAVALLAGLTMTIGNILALRQRSVKRLLAYSSIAHAGYIMMGVVAGTAGGYEASVFYVAVYMLMTIASFGVVLLVSGGTNAQYLEDSVESYRGLGWKNPILGIVLTIALLSLAGLPPFAGFFAKLYVFAATVKAGYVGLAILAALNSVVSLYYYLSLVVVMYFSDSEKVVVAADKRFPFGSKLAVGVSITLVVLAGVFSQRAMNVSREAIRSLNESKPRFSVSLFEDRGDHLVPYIAR